MASTVEYEDHIQIVAEVVTVAIVIGVPFAVIATTVAVAKKIKGIFRKVDQLEEILGAVQVRIDMIQHRAKNVQDCVEELEKGNEPVPDPELVPGQRRGPVNVRAPAPGVAVPLSASTLRRSAKI